MLSYKYSFDEIYDRPLIPERKSEGKRSWKATLVILPILIVIGAALVVFSPVKGVQLLVEKFSE